jgi:hypothetical protein
MKKRLLLFVGLLALNSPVHAGNPQRIGHTTFLPRHSSPDDKGQYTAFIDPTNGYAYFVGNYLTKVDITVDPPQPIGAALSTGQFINSAIDVAAGTVYFAKTSLYRYSLGSGTNPVTANGSLILTAGTAAAVVLDDSDPDPKNHNAYVLCGVAGSPYKVAKVALSTFTELNSITLNTNETNFVFGSLADAKKGYAYFVTGPSTASAPLVVKVKMTPGANAPVRIGTASLNSVGDFIDGASIDTVHGYAYYGTYNSDTNVVGRVYKVKLEYGDVPPTFIGYGSLKSGEGRLAASVLDPQNGFVYFADDNSYPGSVYQLSLNGTNPPVEISRLLLQAGPSNAPPNGVTAANETTNADGILPYGEVYFRSAVIDPLRGYAYFAQDSRPNQIVKVKLAQVDPFALTAQSPSNSAFQLSFTNISGASFSVFTSTNLSLPFSNWTLLSNVPIEASPGQYQFTDSITATNLFYRIRAP